MSDEVGAYIEVDLKDLNDLKKIHEDDMWRRERLAMERDSGFAREVQETSEELKRSLREVTDVYMELSRIYPDFSEFIEDYKKFRPFPAVLHDQKIRYSPSRNRAMATQLKWFSSAVKAYFKVPFPYRAESKIIDELEKLNKMDAVTRKKYLEGKNYLKLVWSLNQITEREEEQELVKLKEMRGALAREQLARAEAEQKEEEKEKAEKLLRKTLEEWVKEERDRYEQS